MCFCGGFFFRQRNFRRPAGVKDSGKGAKAALGAFLGGGRAYAQNGLTPAWKSAEGRRAQRDLALAGSGRPVFWRNEAGVRDLPRGGILAYGIF